MFNAETNISLLWEIINESDAFNITEKNIEIIKTEFIKHINIINQEPNISLQDKNKKFIDEFITISRHINLNLNNTPDDTVFEKLLKSRQQEFNKLMAPEKPIPLKIGDSIEPEGPDPNLSKKLEDFKKTRNFESWNVETPPIYEETQNISNQFIDKLKNNDNTTFMKNISKKVSFTENPSEHQQKINDVVNELKEIKRKVSRLINVLEINEINI